MEKLKSNWEKIKEKKKEWLNFFDSVLEYDELGKKIAENGDEYLLLSTGRIIEFEL